MPPVDHEFHGCRRVPPTAFLRRIRNELIGDAPADLDEVEAAIDAESRPWWITLVRLALLAYTVGFWLVIGWVVIF
jgi:hypothetical protein